MSETLTRPEQPSLWEATKYWLKLGFISFGGPAGQISIMHQELVKNAAGFPNTGFYMP